MAWAWELEGLSSTEKLVLIALADHADHKGVCWPGQDGIAAKCSLGRQTVNKTLQHLASKGHLKIIHRTDPYGRPVSNYYHLSLKVGGNVSQGDMVAVVVDDINPSDDDTNHQRESSEENHQEEYRPTDSPHLNGAEHTNGNGVEKLTPEKLLEGWNEICAEAGLAKVLELSGTRRTNALRRLKEHPTEEWWEHALNRIANSMFCRGLGAPRNPGEKPWKASFDWLIANDTNALKAYEGKYR